MNPLKTTDKIPKSPRLVLPINVVTTYIIYIYIFFLVQISGLACQQLLSSKEHKDDEEYDPLLETCTGYSYTALLKTIHPDAIPGRLLITLWFIILSIFFFIQSNTV